MFTRKNGHMKNIKMITALTMTASLVACGGGGDDNTAKAPTNASAEGFWTGSTSNNLAATLAILENGETWGFYTTNSGSLAGALYGNTAVSGTSVSGTSLDFYSGTVNQGSYTGTVSTKDRLTLSTGGTQFNGSYSSVYEQAASLSSLAGTYSGYALTGRTSAQYVAITISSTGKLTAGDANCALNGTATPRASGKNIFNLNATFTGSYCALGNGATVNGIVYYDTASRSLVAMGLNGSKTDGFIYSGKK